MYEDKELIINIQEWLDEQGFGYDERTNELIAHSCFNCGRSKKLYINKETGFYNCFRCGIKGNAISLVMKVGNLSLKKAKEICYDIRDEKINTNIEEIDFENSFKITGKKGRAKKEQDIPDPIHIPKTFHKLTKADSLAWNYLKKRGLTDEIIEELNLYYWKDAKRVVFTIDNNGSPMGYMARDITGSQDPKTLNSKGNFRNFYFWNYDRVKEQDTIIICEGIFSAIKAGIKNSIALLGKVATKDQIELLRTTKAKKIILSLDVGTEDDQMKIYEELSLYYPGSVYRIVYPPIIELKEEVSDEMISKVNSYFKTKIIKIDNKTIKMNPKEKEYIKKYTQKGKMILLPQEYISFIKDVLNKADYKDAGDYSFEEMQEFIKKAVLFKRSDF